MKTNVQRDFFAIDGLEPVKLTSVRQTGQMTDIVSAKRLKLSAKERQGSGGAYTQGALTWLIPSIQVETGLVKAGDTIQPAKEDGPVYTVLEMEHVLERSIFRCVCVALSIAYDLQDVIDVERAQGFPGFVQDASGRTVKNFPPAKGALKLFPQVQAKVQALSMEIANERGMRGPEITYDVFCSRQMQSVSNEDRLLWFRTDGTQQILEIRSWRMAGHLEELFTIQAQAVV